MHVTPAFVASTIDEEEEDGFAGYQYNENQEFDWANEQAQWEEDIEVIDPPAIREAPAPACRSPTPADNDLPDIRQQLKDLAKITKITYTVKNGSASKPGFDVNVDSSWCNFRSILLSVFKLDPAVHDTAEFQFALASTPGNRWIAVDDEKGWTGTLLHAIFTNYLDREGEKEAGGKRKSKLKEALPLIVRVVSSYLQIALLLFDTLS
jgi:hypothetical protein